MKFLIKICIAITLCCGVKMRSQNIGNYSVTRITPDEGLSQGSNYFWFEDRRGFVWLTCNDALNRYDGSSVKVYNLKYYFKNCPTLQQAYGFAEDKDHLYIGSTRGLYIYDYQLDEFTLVDIYQKYSKSKTAIPIGFSDGKIWIFNEAYQLASFDVKTKQSKQEAQIPVESLKSVHIYDLDGNVFYFRMPFFDKHRNICFIGTKEIITYNLESQKTAFPFRKLQINPSVVIQSGAYDQKNDALYLGTVGNGILVLNDDYQKINYHQPSLKRIESITVKNNKIVLMSGNSLFIFDMQFKNGSVFPRDFERAYNLQFDKIGRLWFCDDGQGEVILDFRGAMLKNTLDGRDSLIMSFKQRGVSDLVELPDHTILVNSVTIFNPKDFSTKKFASDRTSYYSNSRSKSYKNPYTKELWMVENNLSGNHSKIAVFDEHLKFKKSYDFDNIQMGKHQSMVSFPDSTSLFSFSTGLYFFNKAAEKFEKLKSIPKSELFFY
ncbi:MAG: hypothetical protein MUW56_12820 [Chryseobacterium sp.]|uniref:ligand-binding sensor domain-containing protein n=1 Tax=Chryseobacterium sp. TaxID=1871047 RepID=UPI0025C4C118|nr:hypothetical protein [Chryseobacterium sp.]MCJ7934486.1 hypothetical protein [Chryseobacterium sp.]